MAVGVLIYVRKKVRAAAPDDPGAYVCLLWADLGCRMHDS